jgi:hypothetical protein
MIPSAYLAFAKKDMDQETLNGKQQQYRPISHEKQLKNDSLLPLGEGPGMRVGNGSRSAKCSMIPSHYLAFAKKDLDRSHPM